MRLSTILSVNGYRKKRTVETEYARKSANLRRIFIAIKKHDKCPKNPNNALFGVNIGVFLKNKTRNEYYICAVKHDLCIFV